MSKSVVESEQAIDTLGGWERNWMYYVCAMAVFVSFVLCFDYAYTISV